MHYRGLAKKRLFPVRIEGTPPAYGVPLPDDRGEMRGNNGPCGLALLKIDAVQALMQETLAKKRYLICRDSKLWPTIPPWMKIDDKATNR
jgi:hypothetical protein